MKRHLLLGFFLLLSYGYAQAANNNYYILGIQDYAKSAITVAREYESLAQYLAKTLGKPVRIESVKTADEYLKKADAKRYDFMFGPPSMIMAANKRAGYEPLVKVPGLLSHSFMALSSTGIAFPEDMKGKRIGFYEKDAMITQLAIAQLKSENIDPETYFSKITYYRDFNDVLTAMKYNVIDVGVANATLYNVWTARGNDLNAIMSGKGVPHLTFAVRPDFPPAQRAALNQSLLKAHLDGEGKVFFKYNGYPNFETAQLKDYEELVAVLGIK